jgi:hypothetical protein
LRFCFQERRKNRQWRESKMSSLPSLNNSIKGLIKEEEEATKTFCGLLNHRKISFLLHESR